MTGSRRHSSCGRPLTIWKFNDGLRGHENQSSGLVEALARKTEVSSHEIAILRGAAQLQMAWRIFFNRECRDLPDPDLLVGAGHATHLPLVSGRRARGGRAIVIMAPSLPTSWFDLIICPNHDRIPAGDNVIVTRGALNRARPGAEQNPSEGLILVGGPDRFYGWSSAELSSQIEQVVRGSSVLHWAVASSRRTPAGLLTRLNALHLPNLTTFAVADVDDDWLPDRLASAATVWVTEDSVSMIHEAITARAATGLLAVPRLKSPRPSATRWYEEGIGKLVADSMLTPFEAWQNGHVLSPSRQPLDEAQRCSDWILKEWFPARV